MSFFTFENVEIVSVAAAVPKTTVRVSDFAQRFGESVVEKFMHGTGVREYRRAAENQTASDLGKAAAEQAIARAGVDRDKIGVLAFVSLSQDYLRPATACVLQHRLGLPKDCAAFDVGMGCSGFVYGLQVTAAALNASDAEWALLIVSDAANRLMYPNDRSTVMLIGDAGTAIVLRKSAGHPVRALLGTDGAYAAAAIVPAGGFRNRDVSREPFTTEDGTERTNYHYLMNGMDIFSYAMSDIPAAFRAFYERTGTSAADYDSVVLHQANKMIIDRLAKKIGADANKVPICLDRYGNTSSAAIPLTLCDAYAGQEGALRVLCCGFGTGLSYGVASFTLDLAGVCGVIDTDETYDDGLIR